MLFVTVGAKQKLPTRKGNNLLRALATARRRIIHRSETYFLDFGRTESTTASTFFAVLAST